MKILLVTHYFGSHGGGIERVANHIFRGLPGPDCHVLWAAADVTAAPAQTPYSSTLPLPSWNGFEEISGLPLPIPTIGAVRKLYSALKDVDVLMLHDCLYASNMLAYLFARRRRIPVIIVQHIGMVPYGNAVLRYLMAVSNRLFTRPMLASAQQVVFISQITKRYFRRVRFQRPPIIIYNGVDCEIFHPARHESKAAIRARLGLPSDRPVALFVGRFVEKKGLRILQEVAAREQGITWAFAGDGPLDPSRWRFDNVRVYSGLRDSSLADLYRASDIFVLPSAGEGLPLVLQEALASGLAVLCSSETAAADDALAPFLRAVELTPTDQSDSAFQCSNAIHDLLKFGKLTGDAQQRHDFVRFRYSWPRAVNQYFKIVFALAARSGGATSDRPSLRKTVQAGS